MYPPRTRIITALGLALYAVFANAADIQVKMIDISKTEGLVAFEPTFVKANVNDTIVFTSTNPEHNAGNDCGVREARRKLFFRDDAFRFDLCADDSRLALIGLRGEAGLPVLAGCRDRH